jgi:hypothetical protein
MTLDNGATVSSTLLSFGGSDATNILSASILSGSNLTTGSINAGGSYASASILVDGGHLKLTTANESASFGTPSSSFAVQYESGTIVWSGVANTSEFSAFKNGSYANWINDGHITSSLYTNAELNNGLIFVAGTGAVLVLPSSGVTYTSTTSGDFNTASTWGGAGVPGVIDTATIREHEVTVSGAQGSIGSLNITRATSDFIMNSGSSLTVTNEFSVNWGNVNVNGGTLNHTGSIAVYVGKVASSSFDVIGGTFTTNNQIVVGAGNTLNNTSSITIDNGGSVSATHLSFGGSDATNNLAVSILNGSDLTVGFVSASGSYASASILVDGGDFTLTTTNESGSLGTPSANFAVQYESGTIVWSGVANTTEFSAFKSGAFINWLTDGFITSSLYTNVALYNGLTYIEGVGAVLANPETSVTGPTAATTTLALQNDGSFGDININMTPSFGQSSSDTSTLTGTLGIELKINTDNDTVSSLTMISSNMQGTPVSFSGGSFFNPPEYNVSSSTVGVSLTTTTPPGAVDPSTGNYNVSEHPFSINQGTMSGSATLLGQNIPVDVNFAETPLEGANTGTGANVAISLASSSNNSKTYNVTLIYPVNTTDTLPVNDSLSITVVTAGTVKATGTITVPILTDFEIWRSDNSLAGATFEGDSNQDGLANGLQWALGLAANVSPVPHLLTFATSTPSATTYTITLPAGGSAGALTVSYTPNLTTAFTPLVSGAVNVGNPIPAGTTGTVTITLPAGDQGFLKMSAVAP